MSQYWSAFVSSLDPYVPGEQPKAGERVTKLNTNENPYPPSPKVQAALDNFFVDDLRRYPDPESQQLSQTIADYHGVGIDNIFVGNGSDEVLGHAFNAFFRQSLPILFPDITYSFYPVYCNLYGISYRRYALTEQFEIDLSDYTTPNGGIIFANPNAPTGVATAPNAIRELLEQNRSSVVIVDEAYVDFAEEELSVAKLTQQYPQLLVVQTLSKSRSLAGLRLGYAIGSELLIEGLKRVKNSFNSYPIDQFATVAAQASFADEAYFQQRRQQVIAQREYLVDALTRLDFTVLPSAANFVMAKPRQVAAAALCAQLKNNNILVRYFEKPRINDYLRISVGSEQENQRLINALESLLT